MASTGERASVRFFPKPRRCHSAILAALEKELATKRYAAFFVEPIQAEGGIRVPEPDYLGDAQDLCRRYGTLLVADEVQTGMFRTGPFLASHILASRQTLSFWRKL